MLFNTDLFDTICEVQIRFKIIDEISNTRVYQCLARKGMSDIIDEASFYEEIEDNEYANRLIMSDNAVSKWFMENLYHDCLVKQECLMSLMANLIIKFDERKFIEHKVSNRYDQITIIEAAMSYGTLAQMLYLQTIYDFNNLNSMKVVIEKVGRLDIMQFIYSVKPDLFTRFRVRGFLSLLHYSVEAKRDLETLEWLISKLSTTMSNAGFDTSNDDDSFSFFLEIVRTRDESLLEWICLNRSHIIRPAFKCLGNRAKILYLIGSNFSQRVFLLFAQNIYVEHNHFDDSHEDMISNLSYIANNM